MSGTEITSDWLTDDVIAAVARHMNDDHTSDSLTMVRPLCPAATSATVIGLDYSGLHFAVVTEADETVQIGLPWPGDLTARADIRTFVVALHTAACEQLGLTSTDHAEPDQREEVR